MFCSGPDDDAHIDAELEDIVCHALSGSLTPPSFLYNITPNTFPPLRMLSDHLCAAIELLFQQHAHGDACGVIPVFIVLIGYKEERIGKRRQF